MHQGRHVLEDLNAAEQHATIVAAAGAVGDLMVDLAGDQYDHPHAAGGSVQQRLDHRIVRDKVGVRNQN